MRARMVRGRLGLLQQCASVPLSYSVNPKKICRSDGRQGMRGHPCTSFDSPGQCSSALAGCLLVAMPMRCFVAAQGLDDWTRDGVWHLEKTPQALCIEAGGLPVLEAAHHVVVQRRLEGLEDGQAPDDGGHELWIHRNASLLNLHTDTPHTVKQGTQPRFSAAVTPNGQWKH